MTGSDKFATFQNQLRP